MMVKVLMAIHATVSRLSVMVVMLVPLVACSQSSEAGHENNAVAGQSSSTNGRRVLTYYLDMKAVAAGDRALELNRYQAAIKNCKSMGATIVPLSPSDIAKLSVVRTRIWQEPGRIAKQVDSWHMTTLHEHGSMIQEMEKALCHFTGVKEESTLTISHNSGSVYSINLVARTGTMQSNTPTVDPGRLPVTKADETAAERRAEATGFVKGSMRQVAGQPCQSWRYSGGAGEPYEECVWSDGNEWGYSATNDGGLVLSNKLDDGSYEQAVTFMVGRLPEGGKIFDIPKNISVRNETVTATRNDKS